MNAVDRMEPDRASLRGLFLNPTEPTCSIYESGRMAYNCLRLSRRFSLDYHEVDERRRDLPGDYDFYLFNYHITTMAWLDVQRLDTKGAPKLTLVLEVAPGDPFALCPPDVFDAYCALDPTLRVRDRRVYAFPRPLEDFPAGGMEENSPPGADGVPIIGTFGFATAGKGFERVVRGVNAEFERALVRVNIPHGAHADKTRELAAQLAESCRREAHGGVRVEVTHDFLSKEQLVAWCRTNTLNCFLYDRNMPGLSATTDQAITSGRPLAVSANSTFRHVIDYITPYPLRSLRESIEDSPIEVRRMQEDWRPEKFAGRFEQVLDDLGLFAPRKTPARAPQTVRLRVVSPTSSPVARARRLLAKVRASDFVPPLLSEAMRRLARSRQNTPPPPIPPFHHPAFASYSQFHEDLLIDLILGGRAGGFYVDVGANHPEFNSNTLRFYRRGWMGVNIEPDADAYRRIANARTRDLNLNVAVGPERGRRTFYHAADDAALSPLDESDARGPARQIGSTVTADEVEIWPLRDIFAKHAAGRQVDLLSVKAEGCDLTVLQANDWEQHRPTLLVIEINNQFREIVQFMASHNYLLLFNNSDNGLFIDKHTTDAGVRAVLNGAPLI